MLGRAEYLKDIGLDKVMKEGLQSGEWGWRSGVNKRRSYIMVRLRTYTVGGQPVLPLLWYYDPIHM